MFHKNGKLCQWHAFRSQSTFYLLFKFTHHLQYPLLEIQNPLKVTNTFANLNLKIYRPLSAKCKAAALMVSRIPKVCRVSEFLVVSYWIQIKSGCYRFLSWTLVGDANNWISFHNQKNALTLEWQSFLRVLLHGKCKKVGVIA